MHVLDDEEVSIVPELVFFSFIFIVGNSYRKNYM